MKRSRIGIRKRQRRIAIGMALFFLVVLPIVAVIIGHKITEWVVVPTINTADMLKSPMDDPLETGRIEEEDKEEEGGLEETGEKEIEAGAKSEAVNLDPLSLYMIQIASVSEDKNIETLANELHNHRFPYIIYKMDNAFKVFTFGATERAYIEEKLEEVREIYPDAYIGQMHIPKKEVNYLSDESDVTKDLVDCMNLIIDMADQSSKIVYSSIDTEEGLNKYKEILLEHEKILGQMSEKINNGSIAEKFASKEDIKKMIDHQGKNISESLKLIEGNQDLYKVQNYFIDSLFRIMEVHKK